ncbi:MAG: hypothetical protein Q8P07_01800 [bacterium]|nr:hypothetical protein [bacterium]
MDRIEKLFRKISANERELLLDISKRIISGETDGLNIEKLSGSDFYRLRKGVFRIIFHYENKMPIIVSIRLKNEKTYHGY